MEAAGQGRPRGRRRRDLFSAAGAATVAMALGACGDDTDDSGGPGSTAAAPDCVLTPEGTEGPYYLDLGLMRGDLTEGRAGVGLRLAVTVVDAETCAVIPEAAVDVWHADPRGRYSGTGADGASGETFLRGVQLTDESGSARFDTLYPGWYTGRTVHIHVKVHVGGDVVHTGQLYFPEEANDAVAAVEEYARGGSRETRNAEDMFYPRTGSESTVELTGSVERGYGAAIVLGVRG